LEKRCRKRAIKRVIETAGRREIDLVVKKGGFDMLQVGVIERAILVENGFVQTPLEHNPEFAFPGVILFPHSSLASRNSYDEDGVSRGNRKRKGADDSSSLAFIEAVPICPLYIQLPCFPQGKSSLTTWP
jgi:hypothetical protein